MSESKDADQILTIMHEWKSEQMDAEEQKWRNALQIHVNALPLICFDTDHTLCTDAKSSCTFFDREMTLKEQTNKRRGFTSGSIWECKYAIVLCYLKGFCVSQHL